LTVSLVIRGFILGFAIAATPGPIFFLCLRRTLTRGWITGVVSGLGVATADASYGALAAFGVTAVTAALVSQRRWLALIGGAALVVLSIRALLAKPAVQAGAGAPVNGGLAPAYLSTLGLTITNPATILSFAAVFAALGVGAGSTFLLPVLIVAGVLLGSASWWLVLASLASVLRARVTPAVIRAISVMSAIAFAAFGLLAIASSLRGG
jgi:threonine/homoserine/homoserine lactone efflux protein